MQLKLVTIIILQGCVQADNPCNSPWHWHQSNYTVNATRITEKGIQVDDSGHNIDLEQVDTIFAEVMECLQKNYPDTDFSYFNVSGLTVKIPGQYVMSCPGPGQQQLLLDEADQSGCNAKGFEYDPDCTCRWRCRTQNNCTAVTTPSLLMLKQPIVQIVMGYVDVWSNPLLAECATP